MKRILLIAALAAILSIGAQAHIGWSLSDCQARYGAEVKPSKNTNSGEIHYFSVPAAGMTLSHPTQRQGQEYHLPQGG